MIEMEKIISKNVITAIPGIGTAYAKRLFAVGITKPIDLLMKFNELDDGHFQNWMKQSCRISSNHAKTVRSVMRQICDNEKSLLIHGSCKDPRSKINFAFRFLYIDCVWNFQQRTTLLHHPNSSVVFYHSQATAQLECDECNLIPNVIDANSNTENDTDCKPKRERSAMKIQKQFSDVHESANKKWIELQEEIGKMQRISFELESHADLSSYEEKFSIFEENLNHIQKAVRTTESKIHKIGLTHQSLMRIVRQIDQRSKRQNEINEKAITTNSRRLARLQFNLNNIAKEMSKQKFDVDDLKSTPQQEYDQLKRMFDERLDGIQDDLAQRTNQIIKLNLLSGFLVLVLLGSLSIKRFFTSV